MGYEIILSEEFLKSFDQITSHIEIEANHPANAQKVKDRVHSFIEKLAYFPNMGHKGKRENMLEFFVPKTPCIVVYSVNHDEQKINIVTLWHTAKSRNPED